MGHDFEGRSRRGRQIGREGLNYAVPIPLTFVRADAFHSLPKAVQEQVMAAAAETENSQFDLLANRTAENYARVRANGVIIAETAPVTIIATLRQAAAAPVASWKAKGGDTLLPWHLSTRSFARLQLRGHRQPKACYASGPRKKMKR